MNGDHESSGAPPVVVGSPGGFSFFFRSCEKRAILSLCHSSRSPRVLLVMSALLDTTPTTNTTGVGALYRFWASLGLMLIKVVG